MNNRYFTKSAYKIALECPTRLYYCCDDSYENQDNGNEFLQSLADGGFQVGELAKIYYHIDNQTTVASDDDYEGSLEITNRLLQEDSINISEGAFCYKKFYIRADIIEKKGDTINLIEVKAKSYSSINGAIITKDSVSKDLSPYIQDVAFQKYVIVNALREQYPDKDFTVNAFLMMADKNIPAPVDGMNKFFRIDKESQGVIVMPGAQQLVEEQHILTAFDVNDLCDSIINDAGFVPMIDKYANAYCSHIRIFSDLSHNCFKCPFNSPEGKKKDGFKECWKEKAGLSDGDFSKPLLGDFSMAGFWQAADKLIKQGKYRMSDLTPDDIASQSGTLAMRRLIQLDLSVKNGVDERFFLDSDGLRKEMKKWKYPLHFIDFETSAAALPYYKGMRPYEDVAFQFSHHIVKMNDDGEYKIEHAGQYLNIERGVFPNFDFIRNLRSELTCDDGTIFRYANHENKILRSIRRQLLESIEPDREELITFIDSITHSGRAETPQHKGDRDMVDLEDVVKRFFIFPEFMKGRTSIKVVLPAVLNASPFLQQKYSQPIYGKEIKSRNYDGSALTVAWVNKNPETSVIENPYHELEKIEKEILFYSGFTEADYDAIKKETGDAVANGGAALTAYSKLQYTDIQATDVLKNALYRYCELDTMAMVFVWEYFYSEINN